MKTTIPQKRFWSTVVNCIANNTLKKKRKKKKGEFTCEREGNKIVLKNLFAI